MVVKTCKCGSCPVLIQVPSGEYRAGCQNEDCKYFGMFTLTDKDKEFVLQQWNVIVESYKEEEKVNS
jgi:hypothetical protein